jgi:hypothetical protein
LTQRKRGAVASACAGRGTKRAAWLPSPKEPSSPAIFDPPKNRGARRVAGRGRYPEGSRRTKMDRRLGVHTKMTDPNEHPIKLRGGAALEPPRSLPALGPRVRAVRLADSFGVNPPISVTGQPRTAVPQLQSLPNLVGVRTQSPPNLGGALSFTTPKPGGERGNAYRSHSPLIISRSRRVVRNDTRENVTVTFIRILLELDPSGYVVEGRCWLGPWHWINSKT